jgi:hypothetical protein
MKKTLIQLVGDQFDIQDLQNGLRTSDWRIVEETDGYYLTSDFLCSITDPKDIESKAKQIIDLLNGASSIINRNHKKIGTGSIIQMDEEGKRSIFVTINETIQIRARTNAIVLGKGVVVEEPPSIIEDWLNIAQKHESVRDILHFFNEITWWNLYKVYEIINDDVGGQNPLYKLVPKTKLRLFTQAAQSRELLGDHARHASKKKYPAPTTPMTIDEALETIKKLFENWIKLKK